jgi:hypothetical protein
LHIYLHELQKARKNQIISQNMIERFFTSIGASIRKSLLLVALAVSLSCGTHADAENLIFTFSDDGEGGTKVVASGGTATAVGASENPLIGVRSSADGGDTGFGFPDDAFPFATFASLGRPMSDPMTLVSGGGLASGEIKKSLFSGTVFTPLFMENFAGPGATLSAVDAPDPEGNLDIPYSAFASLYGTTIVNLEDGWEFRFETVAPAENLIFTFSDDGEGGTRVVASGGTATAVGPSSTAPIGVSIAISNPGFSFEDFEFNYFAFSDLFPRSRIPMSDPLELRAGGDLLSGVIRESLFFSGLFAPLLLTEDAWAGSTLSAVDAPDPEGTLDIPYSAFASLYGTTIVNSEDGWEFRFGAPAVPAVDAPGVLRLSSIRTFGPTLVGRKSRPQIVRITNIGESEVNSISVNIRGRASGEFDATTPVSSLAAGKSTSTKVVFEPKGKGTRRATLNISSSVGKKTLSLAGRGKAGQAKAGYQFARPFPNN